MLQNGYQPLTFGTVVFRLLLAMLGGGILGYGRSKRKQEAGFRTYMVTSMGAALTILISLYEYEMLNSSWAFAAELAELKFDGTRFAAGVISGIGFLAAGSIIAVEHQQVSGLTTAIGLFGAACMGIAAGAGFVECVLIGVALIAFTLEGMQPLEVAFKRRLRNITLYVEFRSMDDILTITDAIRAQNAQLFDLDVEREKKEGENYPSAVFSVKLSRKEASHSAMLSSLAELPCVYSIQELIA